MADARMTPKAAGYMELDGAKKDADCHIVAVPGGISSGLGCCNEFDPQKGVQQFKCGNCTHRAGRAEGIGARLAKRAS